MEASPTAAHGGTVAIAGAGLSGLCLAHGLLQEGFDVQVYEREPSPTARRQGYRLTIDEHGGRALERCLPRRLFDAVRATASAPSTVGYFRLTNAQLGEVFRLTFPHNAADPVHSLIGQVDRATLRTLLLEGLEGRVHFGRAAQTVTVHPDGAVLSLNDGTTVDADLVVGADGIHSPLRAQVLPGRAVIDTGFRGIYGKTPLAAGVLPPALDNSGVMAMGTRRGQAFFLTAMRFNEDPVTVFQRLGSHRPPPIQQDYVMWAVLLKTADAPSDLWDLDAPALHRLALDASRAYHSVLQRLVEQAEVDFTVATMLSATAAPKNWRASRVTLMGDAVHAMPPTGAHGGNTALRDAASLTRAVREAVAVGDSLEDAVGRYQHAMVEYAFKEVEGSVRMLKRTDMTHPLMRFIMLRFIPGVRSLTGSRLVPEN